MCWPFTGSQGFVTIQLSRQVNLTSVVYEHVSIGLLPKDELLSAPKTIEIWVSYIKIFFVKF